MLKYNNMKPKLITSLFFALCMTMSYGQIKNPNIINKPGTLSNPKDPKTTEKDPKQNSTKSLFSDKIGKTVLINKVNIPSKDIVKKRTFSEDKSTITTRFQFGKSNNPKLMHSVDKGKLRSNIAKALDSEPGWDCTTSMVTVSLQDDSFMNTYNEAKNNKIYPGAVYTFDNFYNGSFKEEQAPRNPIRIASTSGDIDGDIFQTVNNPTQIDILNAKNSIAQRTKTSRANKGFKAKIYETSSLAENAIALGMGASGYGANVFAGYETKRTNNEHYLMIDVTQEMFSMIAEIPSNGVFVNPENAKKDGLMFLNSIVYGFRALVSIKVTVNTAQEAANFKAKYSGFGFGAEVNIETLSKELSSNSEVKMYIIGGVNTGFLTTKPNEIMQRLNESLKTLTNKTAAPLYFTFVNMNNEQIKTSSATDQFPDRVCVPAAPKGTKRLYDVKLVLKSMRYKSGDKMKEKIGFDLFTNLTVGDKNTGTERLLCRNKDGMNGCKSVQIADKNVQIAYDEVREWNVNLTEEQLKNASITLGTSYLGLYEKGIYSDKIDPNYKRKKTIKLDGLKLSKGSEMQPNNIVLSADVRSQEVDFGAEVYVIAKDVKQ